MAEPEPAASAAPLVASYFGGNSGIPSYEALKQRRAIALALAARRMRAPQSVGEGMTYFGESLNDALGTYLLGQQEKAYTEEQRRRAELTSKIPLTEDASATPPPVAAPPVRRPPPPVAGAVPSPAPVFNPPPLATTEDAGSGSDGPTLAYAPEEDTPPPPTRLAALDTGGATMSDAPPVGAEPRLPANPPIVTDEIRPAPVQMAGGPVPAPAGAGPSGPPAGVPAPTDVVPGRTPPAIQSTPVDPNAFRVERQPYPKLAPMGPRERQLFGIANAIDDPVEKARIQSYVGELEKQRQADHARRVEEWKNTEALNNQKALTLQQAEIARPGREAELRKLADEERQRREEIARGGFTGSNAVFAKKLLDDADTKKPIIEGTATALNNIKPLIDSIYTGSTAKPRVLIDQGLQLLGVQPKKGLSDTEAFQAFVKELYGPLRQTVIGPGAQSNQEGRNLENAVAGNIGLQHDTIRMVIDAVAKQNHRAAIDYQRPIATFTGNDPAMQQSWYNRAGLDMARIVPQAQINALRAAGEKDPAEYERFDRAHHTPGLARKLIAGE